MAANASGIRAGGAFVELSTKDGSLNKGLRDAESRVKAFGESIIGIGAKIGALGASITAPLLLAAKTFAETGSSLTNMSNRTGMSVESLSTLGFAASQTGTDVDGMEMAIRKMQKALVAGSEENIQAEATFAALGLSVQQLMRLSPDQQFEAIGNAIAKIPNPTAKAGAAMQIFGRAGTILIPLIDNMGALTQKAREFGLVTSTEAAEAGHKLEQSMGLLGATTKKIIMVIGGELAPMLTAWNDKISRIAVNVKRFIVDHKELVMTVYRVGLGLTIAGAAFTAFGVAVWGIGAAIGTVATVLGAIGATIGLLTSPITLVIGGLVGLTAWFLTSTKTGGEALVWLGGRFRDLKTDAAKVFSGISDALKAGNIVLAAQILWSGIKMEWLKGTMALDAAWDTWVTPMQEKFDGFADKMKSVWTDAFAALKTIWAKGTIGLHQVWTTMAAEVKASWQTAIDAILEGWDKIDARRRIGSAVSGGMSTLQKRAHSGQPLIDIRPYLKAAGGFLSGMFDERLKKPPARHLLPSDAIRARMGLEPEGRLSPHAERLNEIAKTRSDAAAKNAGLERGLNDRQQEQIDAVEAARKKQQEAITEAAKARDGTRKDAAAKAVIAAEDALRAEQEKLDKLRGKAKEEAKGVGDGGLGPQKYTRVPEMPEGLMEAVEKAKVDVSGSFQASSIAGMGAGKSVQDDQLKEQKQMNMHLGKLVKTTERDRLAFS